MRIEILAGGGGAVSTLQSGLNSLHNNICYTIQELQKVNDKLRDVTGGMQGLVNASTNLETRIRREESKKESLSQLRQKTDLFLENTVMTDRRVASLVSKNREQFFQEHPRLRPVEPEEKSWWEQRVEEWNKFWQSAGEALANAWNGIKEFVKEHAVELIVGTIAIAVAAVLTVLSGGTLGPVFLGVFKVMLISGLTNAGIAALTGGDVLDAFGDGLASGYMFGGILAAFSAGASYISYLRSNAVAGKPINVELKYKDDWTAAQRAEADAKVKALSKAKTVKTNVNRKGTSASSRYKSAYGKDSIPKGYDIDHTIDLQLGGIDDIINMKPLDLSVNRSLGKQIQSIIEKYPDGTVFGKFTIR